MTPSNSSNSILSFLRNIISRGLSVLKLGTNQSGNIDESRTSKEEDVIEQEPLTRRTFLRIIGIGFASVTLPIRAIRDFIQGNDAGEQSNEISPNVPDSPPQQDDGEEDTNDFNEFPFVPQEFIITVSILDEALPEELDEFGINVAQIVWDQVLSESPLWEEFNLNPEDYAILEEDPSRQITVFGDLAIISASIRPIDQGIPPIPNEFLSSLILSVNEENFGEPSPEVRLEIESDYGILLFTPFLTQLYTSGQPDEPPPADVGGGGGPGCKPKMLTRTPRVGDWQFAIRDLDLPDVIDRGACHIFILDSAPPSTAFAQAQMLIEAQINHHNMNNPPSNQLTITQNQYDAMLTPLSAVTGLTPLLTDITNVLQITYNPEFALTSTPMLDLDANTGDILNFRKVAQSDHDYPYFAMDHGLFISGIITTLVPDVPLYLIEVLNAFAQGTADTFYEGLGRVIGTVTSQAFQGPILVNASLAFNAPLSRFDITTLTVQIGKFHDAIFKLTGHYPCIIAAAGNDGSPPSHPPTKYPAALPTPPSAPEQYVIGVAALNQNITNPQLANYSNSAPEHGFSVFGGVIPAVGGNFDPWASLTQGILGAYIGAFPPQVPIPVHRFDKTLGKSAITIPGWARWSGTSFSTAIITGILGRLIASGEAETCQEAVEILRNTYGPPQPDIETAVLVTQG